jgi:hypothetical protein
MVSHIATPLYGQFENSIMAALIASAIASIILSRVMALAPPRQGKYKLPQKLKVNTLRKTPCRFLSIKTD